MFLFSPLVLYFYLFTSVLVYSIAAAVISTDIKAAAVGGGSSTAPTANTTRSAACENELSACSASACCSQAIFPFYAPGYRNTYVYVCVCANKNDISLARAIFHCHLIIICAFVFPFSCRFLRFQRLLSVVSFISSCMPDLS